jgi:hypothetical protein
MPSQMADFYSLYARFFKIKILTIPKRRKLNGYIETYQIYCWQSVRERIHH